MSCFRVVFYVLAVVCCKCQAPLYIRHDSTNMWLVPDPHNVTFNKKNELIWHLHLHVCIYLNSVTKVGDTQVLVKNRFAYRFEHYFKDDWQQIILKWELRCSHKWGKKKTKTRGCILKVCKRQTSNIWSMELMFFFPSFNTEAWSVMFRCSLAWQRTDFKPCRNLKHLTYSCFTHNFWQDVLITLCTRTNS